MNVFVPVLIAGTIALVVPAGAQVTTFDLINEYPATAISAMRMPSSPTR